jgi:hypothetical protein
LNCHTCRQRCGIGGDIVSLGSRFAAWAGLVWDRYLIVIIVVGNEIGRLCWLWYVIVALWGLLLVIFDDNWNNWDTR